jgi:hypothetical protein
MTVLGVCLQLDRRLPGRKAKWASMRQAVPLSRLVIRPDHLTGMDNSSAFSIRLISTDPGRNTCSGKFELQSNASLAVQKEVMRAKPAYATWQRRGWVLGLPLR